MKPFLILLLLIFGITNLSFTQFFYLARMKYLTGLIFVFFIQKANAQTPVDNIDRWKRGTELGVVRSDGSIGLNYYLGLTLEKGKHTIGFSPIVGNSTLVFLSTQTRKFALNGCQIGYEIDPFEKGKKFEFFFFYHFLYQHYKYEIEADPPSIEISMMHRHFFNNTVGSGFRWNLSDRFYIKNKIGVGLQVEHQSVKFETQPDESRTNLWYARTFHLGVGIRF